MKNILTKPFGYVTLGDKSYVVEVVSDEDNRVKGLSKRIKLDNGFGMLFEMDDDDMHSFQMSETYLPLDMVFINKKGKVVDYIANAQPLTDGPYKSKENCSFVLEVAGNDLKDTIEIGMLTRMRFFGTMQEAQDWRENKQLQEMLVHYLKEEICQKATKIAKSSKRKSFLA